MTELEEAELTDGQGRALSAHTSKAYEGYAKRTMMRALAATRKRHAHRLATASANVTGTEFQNGPRNVFQNEGGEQNGTANRSTVSSGYVAGAGGFEPPHGGIKIRCLTAWLRPNRSSGSDDTVESISDQRPWRLPGSSGS